MTDEAARLALVQENERLRFELRAAKNEIEIADGEIDRLSATEKRIEVVKLLSVLRQQNETTGDVFLRGLRALRAQSLGTQEPVAWRAARKNLPGYWVYFEHDVGTDETRIVEPLYASPPVLVAQREALKEAIAVFEGMCDDEIEVELLPRLRAALKATPATGGET